MVVVAVAPQYQQAIAQTVPVSSEEPVASPDPTLSPENVPDAPDYQKDIAELTASYRGQLAEYRTLEQEYIVAKEQYRQLKTLAALEEGIQKTKLVMLSRQQVMETYLRLLKVQLLDAQGVEVTVKEKAISQIDNQLVALGVHRQEVEAIDDRLDIVTVSEHFDSIGPAVEQTGFYALSLLGMGRLQVVVDKSRTLKDDIAAEVDRTDNQLTKSQRQRAITETTRTLDAAQSTLSKLKEQLNTNQESVSRSSYAQLMRDVEPAYASAAKALSFLDEVLRTYGSE